MGMELSSLFALPDGLEVAETSVTGPVLALSLVATATTALCPLCGHVSQHIRSSYASAQETGGNVKPASALPDWHVENDPLAGSVHLARHAERLERYQQLVQLREEGLTQKEIARRMG